MLISTSTLGLRAKRGLFFFFMLLFVLAEPCWAATVKLTVQTGPTDSKEVEVPSDATIQDAKKALSTVIGMPAGRLLLLYKGERKEEGTLLKDCEGVIEGQEKMELLSLTRVSISVLDGAFLVPYTLHGPVSHACTVDDAKKTLYPGLPDKQKNLEVFYDGRRLSDNDELSDNTGKSLELRLRPPKEKLFSLQSGGWLLAGILLGLGLSFFYKKLFVHKRNTSRRGRKSHRI